jgi:hypothetical protein
MLPTMRNSYVATLVLDEDKNVSKKTLHGLLMHAAEESAKKMASFYGWKVTGNLEVCDDFPELVSLI